MKTYQFTDNQINVILDSLARQPYMNVFEIINLIQQQYNSQNNTEQQVKESE